MRLEHFPMDEQTLYMQLECFTRPDDDVRFDWSKALIESKKPDQKIHKI